MDIPTNAGEFIGLCNRLSQDELMKLHGEISHKVVSCQLQLDAMYKSDQAWLTRVNTVIKHSLWRIQTIDSVVRSRRRDEHIAHQRTVEATFVNVAKELLDPDVFTTIYDEASQRCVSNLKSS